MSVTGFCGLCQNDTRHREAPSRITDYQSGAALRFCLPSPEKGLDNITTRGYTQGSVSVFLFLFAEVSAVAITKTVEAYDEQGDIVTRELPARWEICEACEGEGHYPGLPYGGTFTSSDIAEDPDMLRDVRRVRCDGCNGNGKVLALAPENMDAAQKAILEAHRELMRDRAESAAYSAAERAVGA